MKRLMLLLTFVVLLTSACSWVSASARPSMPRRDPQVMAVVLQNDAVRTMLAGRKEGSDYWVRIDYVDRWKTSHRGDNPVAMVVIYLDPPVSFSGDVPSESDPCRAHYDDDGYLIELDDPCTRQASDYYVVHRDFLKAGVVTVEVDLRRDEVVQVFQEGYVPDELADVKSLCGTPQPTPQAGD